MGDGDRIDVKVGVQGGELKTGMDQSAATVKAATDKMQQGLDQASSQSKAATDKMQQNYQSMTAGVKGHVNELHSAVSTALGKITTIVMGVGAVLAGGSWFKSQIDETVKWNSEALKLSKTLGITTEEASALNETVQDLGVATLNNDLSVGTLMRALAMMRRELANNEQAFNDLGIETRESNGEFKNSLDIFLSAMGYLSRLKGETAQNVQGTKLFKRSWEEVRPLMGLTEEAIANTSEKLREQGRLVSQEGIEKSIRYKQALDELDDAKHALSLTIGNAVTPALTKMAQGLNWVLERLSEVITASGSAESGLANFWAAAGHGPAAPGEPVGGGGDWGEPPKRRSGGGADIEKPGGAGAGGGDNIIQAWRNELEQMKMASGRFLESSLADDKKYWEEKLALCQKDSKEYTAVQHEVYNLTKQLARQEYQERLADLKARMGDERKNSQEKIALQNEALKEAERNFGRESVEYKNLLREKNAMLRQAEIEARQLRIQAAEHEQSLFKLDLEMAREDINFQTEMGRMSTNSKIQELKRLERVEYQYERNKLMRQRAEYAQGEKDYKKYTQDLEKLDKQHDLNQRKLDQQAVLSKKKIWDQLWDTLAQNTVSTLQQMALGTMTFAQGVTNILTAMGQAVLQMVAEIGLKWVAGMLYAAIMGKAAAVTQIMSVGGFAYMENVAALIPIVGPFAAPGVAAGLTTTAIATATGISAAARGQWRVPQESLYILHPEETVLPAGVAESWRQIVSRGVQPQAPAGPSQLKATIPITVVTPDGRILLKQNKTLFFDLVNQGIKRREIVIPVPSK